MATYTIELRKICDIYSRDEVKKWFMDYNLSDYLQPTQIEQIETLNMWSKEKLADKIIDHFYMREIGFETPGLFKHYTQITMKEIMAKYLPIIYTQALEYNPLESVNFTITENRNIDNEGNGSSNSKGSSNSNSNNNSSGLSVNSDTPQGQINKNQILNGKYASNTTANESTSNIQDTTTQNTDITNQTKSNTQETLTHKEIGNKGVMDSYQKQIMMYRETIFATNLEIINELQPLFMGLY